MSLHEIKLTQRTIKKTREILEMAISEAGGVRALSRELGCSAPHITNIRLGKTNIGPKMAIALAHHLGEPYKPATFRPDIFWA